jgi:hypothetical protein
MLSLVSFSIKPPQFINFNIQAMRLDLGIGVDRGIGEALPIESDDGQGQVMSATASAGKI